ncbi:HAD family hydrolase [Amycolatopsis thailandensis]|uniref:HAD family hydrolase n=1 Tax=Amycolatopsis thailandensis TaxID=589330 RepID=A0A229RUF6_9PSEU|nr:HAD family phosphatase [Amycolatopsis thailandensis]OXM50276.1 HAD family hydrolase [Amycolatopsis thailandensis]
MTTPTPAPAGAAPSAACGCAPAIPDDADAVIFDFDGTLADTTARYEHALRTALNEFGVELDPAWYRRHLGLSIHDLLAQHPGTGGLPHEEIVRLSRARLLATVRTLTPNPCVLALLRAARQTGLACAVASGAVRVLLEPGIAALGLTRELPVVVARDDVACGKPAPDLYLTAARKLGIPPRRCLAVDDAPDGIAAARTAGMRVIEVRDGHLSPTDTGAVPSRPRQQGA